MRMHAASMITSMLDTGTARLFHQQTGSGPDLVFVHGWPLHGETFRAIVPRLPSRFTCHVIDLPGAGKTEWTDDTRIDVRGHTDTLLRAIDALKLERFAFVAHDSGAAIARIAAAELGSRRAWLVLGNTEIPGYHPPAI